MTHLAIAASLALAFLAGWMASSWTLGVMMERERLKLEEKAQKAEKEAQERFETVARRVFGPRPPPYVKLARPPWSRREPSA